MIRPVVIVHDLGHARAAATAAAGQPLALLSPAGAAGIQGVQWWLRLMTRIREEFASADLIGILDCADCPGWAFAALRLGVDRVILSGDGPAQRAVREAAEQKGAWGEGRWGNDALDLLGAPDPGKACQEFFQRFRGNTVGLS